MQFAEDSAIKARIDRIRALTGDDQSTTEFYEAASLAQSVVHDTVGGSHPSMSALQDALKASDYDRARAASRSVAALYDEGAFKSPRLLIAGELEGDIVDLAEAQARAAETATDPLHRQVNLAIAAFLAGAALEDALRRLCDARGLVYDSQRTNISKLQGALYQPSKQVEVISQSENKHVTAWADTRNKADHGRFSEITQTEVVSMVLGVRSFVEKPLS